MSIDRGFRPLSRFWSRLHTSPRTEVRILLAMMLALALLMVVTSPVLAGPGGQFAKVIFKSTLGQIALVVLGFILLPLALYVWIRQAVEVRKTRRDLAELAKAHDYFDWAQIETRIEEAAAGIGHAWGRGDLGVVADYMTEDYFQSQQELQERWRQEGKRNVHEFFDINKIKPLFVRAGVGWWRDQVSVLISATVVDYLQDVETGKVLKGKKRKDRDYETIWNLVREHSAWRLDSIEEGSESLNVALRANRLELAAQPVPSAAWQPQPSELPAAQVVEDLLAAHGEQAAVEVADDDDGERNPGEEAQDRQQQG